MAGAVLQAIAEKIDVGKIGDLESLQAQVKTMSRVEVVDFFQKIQLELPRAQSSNSYFAYVASHELSGFPAGVISLAQRAKKLKQACYFAACYADQLVLMDPFVDMLDGLNEAKINSKFISDFSFFIFMLIMMDPLIESGIVTFARGKGEVYCADCFHKLVSASDNSIPNLEIVKRVTDKLVHAAKVRLVSIDGNSRKCTALVEGPSEFFGDEPYELVFPKQGRILTNKDVGRLISPDKIRSLQLLHTHSQYSALDISTRADISENYGISRSFVSSGEIALLKRTFGDSQFSSSNLECDAPILMANSLGDLISLREQEWHHFEKFRNAFHNIIGVNNEEDLETIYRDVVIPEMVNIERVIEKSRSSSGKEIIKNSGVAALAVTSTIMTAGLSTLFSTAAGVLGGGHFVKSMIPAVQDYISVPDEVKDSEFYYAWKLKKIHD